MFSLSPFELETVLLSLRVAGLAILICLVPGVAIGWLLGRRNFAGKSALDLLVHLPMVAPPVVAGYLLLLAFGRNGFIGAWIYEHLGVSLAFSWAGAAMAAAIMSFPLLVRSVRLSAEAIDPRLEMAAGTLGASPVKVFLSVTLPLMSPGILAGMISAYARALGEFGATITFAASIPGETRTLPLAIYALLQSPGGEAAATRLMALSLLLAAAALIASEYFNRKILRRLKGNPEK